ncbi:hypothetical protein [Microcystis aeruginosa]|nr:hypothetical protein [Microcystis aeruginosa]
MVKSDFLDEAEAFSAFFVVDHWSGNSGVPILASPFNLDCPLTAP